MDILILKLGAMGDVINTLPLVINMKNDLDARIHWLVEPLSFPLVSTHPSVDEAILFDKNNWKNSLPGVVKRIQSQEFDITLDLQRILKSSMLCMASKSKRRIGFDRRRCKEMTWLMPFERIGESDPEKHMVLQYLDFAEYLDVNSREIRWDIPVEGAGPFDLPEDYIVLNIGATKPANRWTPEGFAVLSRQVEEKFGLSCVLTGGPGDIPMARAITADASPLTIDLTGKTSVIELKEVIAASRLVVSCDTGPMHLAVALGKEVIALFGPANPTRTGPFRGKVITKNLPCSPCNKRNCDNPLCMKAINPEDIMNVMEAIW